MGVLPDLRDDLAIIEEDVSNYPPNLVYCTERLKEIIDELNAIRDHFTHPFDVADPGIKQILNQITKLKQTARKILRS